MHTSNIEAVNLELLISLCSTILKKWGLDEMFIQGIVQHSTYEEMSGLITLNRILKEHLGPYLLVELWLSQPAFFLRGISPIQHIYSIGLHACPDIALAFHVSKASSDSVLAQMH